ncbi:hypothetical protein CMUS01_03723 [Colletotrichum musicola]|uniref:Choice-of-anchor B family protein n=1 Tax=Colletotrichum musicola TaxID=2175873 RepID=A0A8H6U530_9PEZI|nr:hypothetical protein CMUS01_03723 [Colletotrichum musicola]
MMNSMFIKKNRWQAEAASGAANSSSYPRLGYAKCVDGKAEAIPGEPLHTFRCKNIDLYDFVSHAELGSPAGWEGRIGSSSWGWTDPECGREFVASGMYEGTAFLEVLPEGRLLHLGFLPALANLTDDAFWKEIRSFKHYMLIGSELANHGVQIFDMRKLLDIDPDEAPITFGSEDLAGHFTDLTEGASHNVVVNEEREYGVAVGSRPIDAECYGGLIFFDLSDPSNPVRTGCNPDDGYVHDAQCLVYRGPDEKYLGRDICYAYNEDTLTIYDVTDKANSSIISITSYDGAAFTHQGWVLDPDWQEWLIMNDEYDEVTAEGPAADGYPVSYIWNVASLESPKQTGIYKSGTRGVDHNLYSKDGLVFQSAYGTGFRVYDVSSIPEDPSGNSVCEIAFFDIYPEDDSAPGGGEVEFSGTWSSYAMFESGFIYINTIERGGFLTKMTRRERCRPKSCNADNCLRAMRAQSVEGRLEESLEFCGDFTASVTADVGVVPTYAASACQGNVISRVSSACSCLPTPP